MNLTQFKRELRHYIDAGITVQMISPPGLGKSDSIDQAVADYNKAEGPGTWGISTVMLATYTPPDLLGYLMPGKQVVTNADGSSSEMRVSEFTMPPWMMSDEGRPMISYPRGIVFFDEWDKADPDVKRAAAEILLKGRAGKWRLPRDRFAVVTASNRAQDRSGSTKEYDFVINRRAEVHIQPDIASWEDWAVRNSIVPLFVTFAKKHPGIVFEGKVPDVQGPFCTPRTLVMASNLLQGKFDSKGALPLDDERQEAMMTEMLTGLIGAPAANQLLTWCKLKTDVPDFDDIVKNPLGTEIPGKPDAKMLVAYECAHRCTQENSGAVIDYALRLPKEFQITFGAAAIKRDHRLLAAKAFKDKFIKQNASLIQLISQ
jgi:hypothetical protein